MINNIVNSDKYDCYIFDFDNTLYSENLYLFSAYEEIAQYTSVKFDLDLNIIKKFLIKNFLNTGRQNLFNDLINSFKLPNALLSELLIILRNHKMDNKIPLFSELESMINELILLNKSIIVLTNGNVQQQKNKMNQIDWKEIKKLNFVFANEIAPKPSPEGVFSILKESCCKRERTLFIGDSEVDMQCAKAARIDFLHVNIILNKTII